MWIFACINSTAFVAVAPPSDGSCIYMPRAHSRMASGWRGFFGALHSTRTTGSGNICHLSPPACGHPPARRRHVSSLLSTPERCKLRLRGSKYAEPCPYNAHRKPKKPPTNCAINCFVRHSTHNVDTTSTQRRYDVDTYVHLTIFWQSARWCSILVLFAVRSQEEGRGRSVGRRSRGSGSEEAIYRSSRLSD
jgi:hypothetical protein